MISIPKPEVRKFKEEQAYKVAEQPTAETHLRELEQIAYKLAVLQRDIRKIPRPRRILGLSAKTTPNQMLARTLVIGAAGTTLLNMSETLFDLAVVESVVRYFAINHPFTSLGSVITIAATSGVYYASSKSDKRKERQVRLLANKIEEQYEIDKKVKELAKQGRMLHSLSPSQARRLQIALGGETRNRNLLKRAYRFITRRKRGGHLFLPGIFNSALNIDYDVGLFYNQSGKAGYSMRSTQVEIDIAIKDYLQTHTYYGSLSKLIVADEITQIPESKKQDYEQEENPEKARLITQGAMKPLSRQLPLLIQTNTPIKATEEPDEVENEIDNEIEAEAENKNGSSLRLFFPWAQAIKDTIEAQQHQINALQRQHEAQQRKIETLQNQTPIPDPSPTDQIDPEIFQRLLERRDRRREKGRNSNYSMGSVVAQMIKTLLPTIPDSQSELEK